MTEVPPDQNDRWRALKKAVRDKHMTPSEAEAEAVRLALPSFIEGFEDSRDITTNATWWAPLTVFFYAWRDLKRSRVEWERYTSWGREIWRDPLVEPQLLTLEAAEEMLLQDLRAGLLKSFGATDERAVVMIPHTEWENLRLMKNNKLWWADDDDGVVKYKAVFMLRHEVVPLWLQEMPTALVPSQPIRRERSEESQPKKMGAALKHDWPAASGFAAAWGMHYDYPAVQADFVERMKTWFAKQGKVPDRRDLERFVSTLYQGLAEKPEE